MKTQKEKCKILKIRPFNMANFSGGSGYLVFSVIYQAAAILPAMAIIWLVSLLKLPKYHNSDVIDTDKAAKRFYAISIPLSVILIIVGIILACSFNYGDFSQYWIEILFVGIAPTICLFFIMRFCHKKIVEEYCNTAPMILLSIGLTIAVLIVTLCISGLIIDPILTSLN
ncbi:MAG: hypothetical protein NC397_09135 [Clostridium sp.]|nr:hypothetical protein [Clostridium sp.]